MRPGLGLGVRLVRDPVRDAFALLYPEGALLLDETAADVVAACDGQRSVDDVVAVLASVYDSVPRDDVVALVDSLAVRRLLVDGGGAARAVPASGSSPVAAGPLPIGLIAELTYRCPLSCGYCSNPVSHSGTELTTAAWLDVLDQARELGVLQVHFSGGEPLLRPDLGTLVSHARSLGMYTNLITSGIGPRSIPSDIDHVQLSVQHASAAAADAIAGVRAHDRKRTVAGRIRAAGIPLTINVVVHSGNVEFLRDIADLAVELGADRLELAHAQYYGWGLLNRAALLPTSDQIRRASDAAAQIYADLGDRMEIVYVEPDHHTGRPKPCMNGWATRQLAVNPTGAVLPCLAAAQLPGPPAPSIRSTTLAAAWHDSELFNRFRGTAWMPSPCRDCALRDVDFGGCRCQAFQLTGDAAATDPACSLSPHHHLTKPPPYDPSRQPPGKHGRSAAMVPRRDR